MNDWRHGPVSPISHGMSDVLSPACSVLQHSCSWAALFPGLALEAPGVGWLVCFGFWFFWKGKFISSYILQYVMNVSQDRKSNMNWPGSPAEHAQGKGHFCSGLHLLFTCSPGQFREAEGLACGQSCTEGKNFREPKVQTTLK